MTDHSSVPRPRRPAKKTSARNAATASGQSAKDQVSGAIFDLVLRVPTSTESALQNPVARAHQVSRAAARKASLISGSMALPPGFLGWITVLPELYGVWKMQAQMVSDIASIYGKQRTLGREQMLYCLFKHVSAQLFRDVVVRVGERVVVREASIKVLQSMAQQVGVKVTQAVLSKSISRFVPLIGAVGVGAYAYFDTLQVAKNAVELFERDLIIEAEPVEAKIKV
ncbi:MAG: hypothetical protein H7293_03195 [Candidatus Saccharibacteria bacterium]|nr:hypothetical protein [Rhodoferax sp.]